MFLELEISETTFHVYQNVIVEKESDNKGNVDLTPIMSVNHKQCQNSVLAWTNGREGSRECRSKSRMEIELWKPRIRGGNMVKKKKKNSSKPKFTTGHHSRNHTNTTTESP